MIWSSCCFEMSPVPRSGHGVEKAWAEIDADVVAMIVPANRAEQGWWQDLVEPRRDQGDRLSTRFYPGRWQFIAHDDHVIRPNSRPPFGIALLVWGAAAPPPPPFVETTSLLTNAGYAALEDDDV